MVVENATIIGVGLIGGSLAGAWRKASFARHIVGVEADGSAAEAALRLGLVDEIQSTVPAISDLIAICIPSDQIAQQVADLASHRAAIFDVGSVKTPILDALVARLNAIPERFVPCHPIAGSEHSGPEAARADLFENATTVITPTSSLNPAALQLVRSAWQATGAEVVELTPAAHDEMLAVTSHLPHLLAFAFMQQIQPEHQQYTGSGFRDFTRIAGANAELWWRILSMNKSQVFKAAQDFDVNLQALLQSLADGDKQSGIAMLSAAVKLDPGEDA